jgi:predicted nucleotidyltransferase
MGIKMPNMGTKAKSRVSEVQKRTSLADALFSTIQQRVLAYLFGQPERSFFATELIKLAGGGSGAVQREVARLADSGLVTVTRVGTQKHYQANPKSPIFSELCAIAQKTVGLAEPLREALKPLAKRVATAFVFGSVSKHSDTATSDIDVLVISDSVDYADVFAAFQSAEAKLGRSVNPTVYTPANWRKKRAEGNAFVVKVSAQPKVFLIGSEEDLV